ncbi:GH39 family glycosyl hydrolase [Haloferula sp.]|uniref:GH39 family glycosyl hydrolase n=1 Tax=Haloferula sp. TaxID=2497595 RepID=UPI003C764690
MKIFEIKEMRKSTLTLLCRSIVGVVALMSTGLSAESFTIDFSESRGKIKPLNGVNGGPHVLEDHVSAMIQRHKEAGFAITRTHDARWPTPDVVDIHTIFPLFHLDADDPKNYYFDKTDDYIAAIVNNGSDVLFRFGESIEHTTAYFIHPPSDFDKWVKICVNILRHYNEGWADGFNYNIKHVEIWNEPSHIGPMWRGTQEQYFELYKKASIGIKAAFPDVKISGLVDNPGRAWEKPFLEFCKSNNLPFDFYSYHIYTDNVIKLRDGAITARKLLDSFGFTETEIHMTEWKCSNADFKILRSRDPERFPEKAASYLKMSTGPAVSSMIGSTLMILQDTPIDMAYYYTADTSLWGMFDRVGNPYSSYYAFLAWREMLNTPNRVTIEGSMPSEMQQIIAGASDDEKTFSFMISNYKGKQSEASVILENLPLTGEATVERYLVDGTHDFELVSSSTISTPNPEIKMDLAPNSLWLVKVNVTPSAATKASDE